ncbi:MAG: D-alanyl-D-alanine carboxypeptidase family protein [Alphaproteobacteria bacterium]
MAIFNSNKYKKINYILLKYVISSILFTMSFNAYAKSEPKQVSRNASLIVDSNTGTILHQENASKHRYPASLTKMMTVYLTFEALKSGKLNLNKELTVSKHAASMPKMNIGLRAGEKIKLKDALMATIIRSANDTSVVLAEAVSGCEIVFAKKMTERAHQIGMHHTLFKNASGLPNPAQKTTAYDMAKLAIALNRDFPEYYSFFSKTSFTFKGNTYHGHNNVTKNYPGATGLKTGYINASGFNLVTSAKRGNSKLIGVVLGGDTAQSRDKKMVALLDKYFSKREFDELPTEFSDGSSKIVKKTVKVAAIKSNNFKPKKVSYKLVSNKKPARKGNYS